MMTIGFVRLLGAAALLVAANAPWADHARAAPTAAASTAVDNPAELSTFTAALKAAGLTARLEKPGPFTIFAPTNAAFDKLPAGTVTTLLKPENRATLTALLAYHIVPGALTAQALRAAIVKGGGKAILDTLQGVPLIASAAGDQIVLTDTKGGVSLVSTPERPRANGTLYIIDTVLMP
jgi:uncharacterized surface protein with fasciclin (FAS1) repeats